MVICLERGASDLHIVHFGGAPIARRLPAGGARRSRPAGRLHYVVISRDGRCN